MVLTLGLTFTLLAASFVTTIAHLEEASRFERDVQHTLNAIQNRLQVYIALLRGAAGFFAASNTPTQAQFHDYVTRLNLRTRYAGIQSIGFSAAVPADELPGFVSRIRRQGQPEFQVWPASPRAEYHAIVYLEPSDQRNRAAIGYDMSTEPVRRAAMERARDSGVPATSGLVMLARELEDWQAGLLVYVPMYRGGFIPGTVEERRRLLTSFVYSSFLADDLLRGTFSEQRPPEVLVEVYDGPAPSAGRLLYRSWTSTMADPAPPLTSVKRLDVAGRTWTLVFRAPPAFAASAGRRLIPAVVLAGLIISVALCVLTWLQVRARALAERTTEELYASQAALRESDLRLKRLMDSNIVGVVVRDFQGRILQTNDVFLEMLGYSRDDLRAGRINWLDLTPAEHRARDQQALEEMRRTGRHLPYEKAFLRRDESQLPVLVATAYLGGQPDEAIGFVVDVSAQKRFESQITASLREKDVLLREIHHRVKNNMQVISSLLTLQAAYVRDDRALAMFRDSQQRINSMALVHEQLYQSKDLSKINARDYIRGLAAQLGRLYSVPAIIMTVEADEAFIGIDTAVACGLIVNELVSNAFKHAFPDGRAGTIRIFMRVQPEGALTLMVQDNGIGLPDGLDVDAADTLGLRLVCALVEQLRGQMAVERQGGTRWLMTLRARDEQRPSAAHVQEILAGV